MSDHVHEIEQQNTQARANTKLRPVGEIIGIEGRSLAAKLGVQIGDETKTREGMAHGQLQIGCRFRVLHSRRPLWIAGSF